MTSGSLVTLTDERIVKSLFPVDDPHAIIVFDA